MLVVAGSRQPAALSPGSEVGVDAGWAVGTDRCAMTVESIGAVAPAADAVFARRRSSDRPPFPLIALLVQRLAAVAAFAPAFLTSMPSLSFVLVLTVVFAVAAADDAIVVSADRSLLLFCSCW